MIKKIVLATALLATAANAEIQQKGFFVGVDFSKMKSDIKYETSDGNVPAAFPYTGYDSTSSDSIPSLKVGYQYYFTRVYARVNSYELEDTSRDKYKIKAKTYELNAEYIPVFYMSEKHSWDIRGIFGFGLGYSDAKITEGDIGLAPALSTSFNDSQKNIEYGYQLGMMIETDIGLSGELGYRYRTGNVIEFTDGQNNSTFMVKSREFYLGLNYLF